MDVMLFLRFDENIDWGFEEVLNVSYNSRESLCSFNGVYVEFVLECIDMGDFFDIYYSEDGNELKIQFKIQVIVFRILLVSFIDLFCEY